MSGRLKIKHARLAVGYAKDDYWLASDLSAGVKWGGNACKRCPHTFLH